MLQLRAVLRAMKPLELEDAICILYRTSAEAAAFFNERYNTPAYVTHLLDEYRSMLRLQLSHVNACGCITRVKNSLEEFQRLTCCSEAALELMLFCVETATSWARDDILSITACNEMLEVFRRFITLLNQETENRLFLRFKERLEQLEWNAGTVSWSYGETLSDMCMDIRWWGLD
ncbi:MAG: hypothetical protein RSB91_06090 [Clostridia bacterium]